MNSSTLKVQRGELPLDVGLEIYRGYERLIKQAVRADSLLQGSASRSYCLAVQ
jgi:hypothetical protein